MKLFFAFLISSQVSFAASPADWNACVQSYLPLKSGKFNVETFGRAPNNTLIFKNSVLQNHGMNIYHKGAFWFADMVSVPEYLGAAKTARAVLGTDAFCLKFDLNLVFRDRYTLSPYSAKCKQSMTLNFQKNENNHSAEVLAKRLKGDIDLGQFCFAYIVADHDFKCSADRQQEDFRKLKKWNTESCKKLNDPGINAMISRHETLLREYPLRRSAAPAAAPAAPVQSPQLNRVVN